jgi:hypothetical protein
MKKQLLTWKYLSTCLPTCSEPRTSYRVITVVLCLFAKFQFRHGLRQCPFFSITPFKVEADAIDTSLCMHCHHSCLVALQ